MAVFYKCKICGEEHQAPLAIGDKVSFDNLEMGGTTFYCFIRFRCCSYDKEDLYWKDEILV